MLRLVGWNKIECHKNGQISQDTSGILKFFLDRYIEIKIVVDRSGAKRPISSPALSRNTGGWLGAEHDCPDAVCRTWGEIRPSLGGSLASL